VEKETAAWKDTLRRMKRHPYYGGGRHITSHGGYYAGGSGSSHKGGHYVNRNTYNTYGRHKRG